MTEKLQQFIEAGAARWITEAMHGFAVAGRGLLLVAVDRECMVGLTHFLPLREVERIPAMICCLVTVRNYSPEHEAAVAFTHGGGKIDVLTTLKRQMIRPDAGEDIEQTKE